jgi:eukaryotic-like serine/threonine-protein kinase
VPGNPIVQKCPSCSKVLDQPARFCPDCGTALTDTALAGPRTPATARRQLALPTVVGNRYKLVEPRGGGGMAQVYKGVDLTLEREVAVKVINPELRSEPEFDDRFKREAKIASQLSDPHIVVVHDYGLDAEHGPYLVMEFLQGLTLRERIASQGKLPLKAALQLSGQLLLALVHAHSKGIVHRDIKPDNIFLLHQGGVRMHVRVLDFGIARIYRSDDPGRAETITSHGAVLGTPRYMSPEQLAGQPVDARSDLYSAALVIHEAITGKLPYTTDAKLSELCPEASPQLQELLDHCLRKDPNARPGSALEVYLRLQELGKASGILLLPPGAMEKLAAARQTQQDTVAYTPRPTDRQHPRSLLLLVVLVAVLLLVLILSAAALALLGWLFGPL